ncbi:p115 like vesicle tethering protein [Blyttiomyces helicus]|uniref:p115 like vesicle tethering protein n=1 Tax=Blyttiomyces helicus TaxID=388810 RepID=A0A4P9WG83_9FUNG|nr:p115 like vesicle tethering protein [Blyttiomyces helicus]|eukprot:RKO90358.1 p115 like vesicle tethering protein [Blyttiomyces helicus]
MDLLFQGYSALRGDKGAPQSGAETVDKLCDRVQHSTLLEDRRAAVQGLKGLARDWKLNVGTKGMPVLIGILRNDRMDVEIIKVALETLDILCTSDKTEKQQPTEAKSDPNDLGVMFTEIYTKDPSNVALLLDILEEVDFYVRFYTVQLLTTLLQNIGTRLQEAILTSPLGISRLIDLLDDRREIIRNEGLLLLIALTQSNAEIQKIIAFENAFERLLGIILEEGATDGGIIVQDCLQLTLNLLKYNVSNQNLFRESSCIHRIPQLLTSKASTAEHPVPFDAPLTHEGNAWTDQKVSNTILVLELVRILVGPKNPNTSGNQNVLHQAKIIPILIDAALAERIPIRVKTQSLYALADSIRGHKANQDLFAKTAIKPPPMSGRFPVAAIMALIQQALLTPEEYAVRGAATYAFQCYLHNNEDGQLALISTLVPPPPDNPNNQGLDKPESAGGLLVSSILGWDTTRKDPFRCWFACVMLSHALRRNPECKLLALSTKFDEGEDEISLLDKCMYALLYAHREGADVRVKLALMSLVCTWLYDCPEAVKRFLEEGSSVQFLIEQINQSSGVDPLVQGVAAYLLGIVYEYNDDTDAVFSRTSLQSLVTSRIGVDVYVSRIERLREAKEFNSAYSMIFKKDVTSDSLGIPEVFFDYSFVEHLKSTHESIVRSITTVQPKGSPPKKNKALGK